jgi:cupin fold WbuC family metalloprotein
MKLFTNDYLNALTSQAQAHTRLRQHQNIHQDYQEPCQRLFNAIEPGSYIRPHRHLSDPRDELLIAIHGLLAVVAFDDGGKITSAVRLGSEKFGTDICRIVEIPPSIWHTVIALRTGSVLLEIKAGPFDPERPKDLAGWAPEENSIEAAAFLQTIERQISRS